MELGITTESERTLSMPPSATQAAGEWPASGPLALGGCEAVVPLAVTVRGPPAVPLYWLGQPCHCCLSLGERHGRAPRAAPPARPRVSDLSFMLARPRRPAWAGPSP